MKELEQAFKMILERGYKYEKINFDGTEYWIQDWTRNLSPDQINKLVELFKDQIYPYKNRFVNKTAQKFKVNKNVHTVRRQLHETLIPGNENKVVINSIVIADMKLMSMDITITFKD